MLTPRPRSITRREKRWEVMVGSFDLVGGFIINRIAAANLAELAAGDNRFDGALHAVIVVGQFALHLGQQAFVAQLHRAAEGESEQLAVELADKRALAGCEQVIL